MSRISDRVSKQPDRKGILAIDPFEDQGRKEPPRPVPSKAPFDRNAYQAQYMRDKRKADKLGLTVAEYRKQER